ncbi:hypothetical protein A2819_00040 [Candidatus Azambacteria bacterium RIFCSPHIGHO2_01_FULL_40_24]|uniref:Uncharacterized protein n=1 Tax=Candidatus Azambacteria bacterium RIFCSPHIGHO2_01_FULL_40_24 TaxID=1797301 RepID=A0A1F5B227_9BACT|nr:MAG: hypothetical protein A2819_00040 [Candidatus Azambacteria bacterium RIFCSPHIGHO2_01_FULL_40_24]
MIVKMRIEHVIETLVEAMLPRFSADKKVLAMSIRISATKPDDFKKEVVHKAHILFHRPGNYTKVLWNITDSQKGYKGIPVWAVKSDHDSEWRTDGLASPMFHLGCQMTKELDPKARPIDCEVVARFDLMGEPKIVTIKDYKYDRDNRTFTIQWE